MYLLFYAGMSFYLIKVWDNSENYWTRAITIQPLAKHYFKRAEYYAKNGRYPEAVKDYSSVLARADGEYLRFRFNVLAYRGDAFRHMGRFDDAVSDLTMAIGLSPRRSYYRSRGLALEALGRKEAAAADFRIAGDDAGAIEYWYREPSLEELSQRLNRNPADGDALLRRASLRADVGEYAPALADMETLLRLDPTNALAYANRGLIYYRQGRQTEALASFDAALRIDGNSGPTYYNRGLAFAAAGQSARAQADFAQARRLGY
jgi:tetratricopeptide (TPR) repeat protein